MEFSIPHTGRSSRILFLFIFITLFTSLVATQPVQAVSPDIVISQVYGGGGNSGAPYTNDFVELFNRGATTVSLSGWSVQYASATGAGNFGSNPIALLSGSLSPGQYYLVQLAGGSTGAPLPTPDAAGTANMAGASGKVALVNTTTGLACNGGSTSCSPEQLAQIIDLVGYGSANFFEGSGAAPAASNTTAVFRANNGCTDTDNNAADFVTGVPMPRNTASPLSPCAFPTNPTGIGVATPNAVMPGADTLLTVSVTPGANPASTGLTVIADLTGIDGVAAQPLLDDGSGGDAIAGDNIFSYLATIDSSISPGSKSLPVIIADEQGRSSNAFIELTVQDQVVVGADIVISQVYGGGGNSGATYTHDFIELYNRGGDTVNITGWSVQYASATGSSWQVTTLSGSMEPGSYYLIQQAKGTGGSTPLPTPDATGTIAMSATNGKVALVNNTTTLSGACPSGDNFVDFVGYGNANCFEGNGAAPVLSNTTAAIRKDAGNQDTDDNAADFETGAPNPRNSSFDGDDDDGIGLCGDPATFIHVVQGNGLVSPLVGTSVIIEGIVVGDFQNNAEPDNGNLDGFFVQEEDADQDGDPATSEGIFVFAPGTMDVAVGDQVRIAGTVAEFFNKTQIASVSDVLLCGGGFSVTAAPVTLPVTSLDDLEAYEGMLITFPQELVISEFFNFDRFGEIVLTTARQYQPTAVYEPGSPEAANLADLNARSRITLDDGRSNQNPDPAIHPDGNVFDLTNRFRGGDVVQNVTGVLDYSFNLYRVHPIQGADYTEVNARPAAPDSVGGRLTVASFNVLNYFSTLDNSGPICGPAADQDCRGADNADEFERQRTKIIAALQVMDADVVGLIEIENHATDAAVQDLVAGLNEAMGAGTYSYVATGPIGTDAIKVALIYKPMTVSLLGDYAILDSNIDVRFLDQKNRPVLAQSFLENDTGAIFTVAVNHLKSKGSDCNDVGDPDLGDGAGNCNLTRLGAAQALVDWLATDPTDSGDSDFLIIGDLNSYDKEDPIDAILAGPDDVMGTGDDYIDLLYLFRGELAYSYVFDGQLGYLDYALANNALLPQVTGTTAWLINADEPDILDYDTSFKQPAQAALFESNAYRASDHDPVIVGLDLNAPPNCSGAFASPDTLWPVNHQMAAIEILGVTDPDGDPITITIDSIFQDEPVNGLGDGDTAPDGAGIGTSTAWVRAERDGRGNGRVYHIFFTATDSYGNSCSGKVLVSVPKNLGRNGAAVDDGPLYNSTLVP